MASKGWKTLGITSAAAGDGKTLTAVNLAVSIAMDMNQTVLLVDADLRRPGVHKCFGFNPQYGLSDYLKDTCLLDMCLVNPGVERLVILPQARSVAESSEVLAMPRTRALTAELKNRYPDRMVLYDLPPLLVSDDALVLLPSLDASLLVVQEGKNEENEIERALELLSGQNWLGSVLNRCERGEGSSYY
jgi:capsular exopolysaccharide synthesis family protein